MNRRRVIIDCDPGIDEALALMLAAACPELEIEAVTCVAGNRPVDTTTGNAAAVLAAAGCGQVPVYRGCERPIGRADAHCNLVHGEDGLGGVMLEAGRPAEALGAVDFLARRLAGGGPPVTLIAIGPLTNLAMAEVLAPGALRRADAVLAMGGAFFCRGNITPAAEFNFYADPVAARIVTQARPDCVLFGLDVTRQAAMPPEWIESLQALPGAAAQAAHGMLAAYAREDPLLHDVCPVAYAVQPGLFRTSAACVSVETGLGEDEGRSHARLAAGDGGQGAAATLLAMQVDGAALLHFLRGRLASLPHQRMATH